MERASGIALQWFGRRNPARVEAAADILRQLGWREVSFTRKEIEGLGRRRMEIMVLRGRYPTLTRRGAEIECWRFQRKGQPTIEAVIGQGLHPMHLVVYGPHRPLAGVFYPPAQFAGVLP